MDAILINLHNAKIGPVLSNEKDAPFIVEKLNLTERNRSTSFPSICYTHY